MRITFERIGRRRDVAPLELPDDIAPQAAAEKLWDYANRFLGSKCFDVSIDLDEGTVWIGGGRFGKGIVEKPRAGDPS